MVTYWPYILITIITNLLFQKPKHDLCFIFTHRVRRPPKIMNQGHFWADKLKLVEETSSESRNMIWRKTRICITFFLLNKIELEREKYITFTSCWTTVGTPPYQSCHLHPCKACLYFVNILYIFCLHSLMFCWIFWVLLAYFFLCVTNRETYLKVVIFWLYIFNVFVWYSIVWKP